ncbi:unnamed protein product, partial [Pylaiella littoralis]
HHCSRRCSRILVSPSPPQQFVPARPATQRRRIPWSPDVLSRKIATLPTTVELPLAGSGRNEIVFFTTVTVANTTGRCFVLLTPSLYVFFCPVFRWHKHVVLCSFRSIAALHHVHLG